MNDLLEYFNQNRGRLIDKWIHYFDVYDRHFARFRNKPVVILEIGVFQGGSLQMWKSYFGPAARIYALDINPLCKQFEEENVKIFTGSQSDRAFLRELKKQIPPIDILIDDGGHTMEQQIVTFEELYDHVSPDGVYLAEDLHTSYWLTYGGGYKRKGTFIEYTKNLIDFLNAYHSEQKALHVNPFTESADSIHYYDSIVVIEKKKKEKPYSRRTGNASYSLNEGADQKIALGQKAKTAIIKNVNLALRFLRLPGFIWK
jgi:hypothetical protein